MSSYNIVAVHRLGKRLNGIDRNVRVRFVNRKFTITTFIDNAYEKIIIVVNPSPMNNKIYNQCFKLKREGIFKSLWSFNGVIHVKFTSNYDNLPTKIFLDSVISVLKGRRPFWLLNPPAKGGS